MDVFDRLRLGERQEIVVALQQAVAGMKTVAAEMRLVEAQALDLGAHRPVKQQDAVARGVAERRQRILARADGVSMSGLGDQFIPRPA